MHKKNELKIQDIRNCLTSPPPPLPLHSSSLHFCPSMTAPAPSASRIAWDTALSVLSTARSLPLAPDLPSNLHTGASFCPPRSSVSTVTTLTLRFCTWAGDSRTGARPHSQTWGRFTKNTYLSARTLRQWFSNGNLGRYFSTVCRDSLEDLW